VGTADPAERYGNPYGSLTPVARKQVLVQLDDALVEALDTQAQAAGSAGAG